MKFKDEEEYEDEMEEEEDEYDEGEDDFDEEDEEEISESRQHFVGRVHARNIAVPPMRSVAQRVSDRTSCRLCIEGGDSKSFCFFVEDFLVFEH